MIVLLNHILQNVLNVDDNIEYMKLCLMLNIKICRGKELTVVERARGLLSHQNIFGLHTGKQNARQKASSRRNLSC